MVGIIGGLSYESTGYYYDKINKLVAQELGGLHSAELLIRSLDFYEIERLQSEGQWQTIADIMKKESDMLLSCGAEVIAIASNTAHKAFENLTVPILHIADAVGDKLLEEGIRKVLLLGTRFTMEEDYIKGRLIDKGIEVEVPTEKELVDDIIFKQLCVGIVTEESRRKLENIVSGRDCVLGCTELNMLLSGDNYYDSAGIHAEAIARYIIDSAKIM